MVSIPSAELPSGTGDAGQPEWQTAIGLPKWTPGWRL